MKTLIAYYSLTGKNRAAAEQLAEELGPDAELDEIIDDARRGLKEDESPGISTYIKLGLVALFNKTVKITTAHRKLQEYDQIVLVTPIYAGGIPPATKTYLRQNKDQIKKPSLLSVSGSAEKNKGFTDKIESELGKKLFNVLLLNEKEDSKQKINDFARKLA